MMWVKDRLCGSEVTGSFAEGEQHRIGALNTRQPEAAEFLNALEISGLRDPLQFPRTKFGLDSAAGVPLPWSNGARFQNSPGEGRIAVSLGKDVARRNGCGR